MARDERTRPTRAGSGFLSRIFESLSFLGPAAISRNSTQCAFAATLLSLVFVTEHAGTPSAGDLVVDGAVYRTVTVQRTVAALLAEVGIDLDGGLTVEPPADSRIGPAFRITVERRRPLLLGLPDRKIEYRGTALTLAAALNELGVVLGPRDRLVSAQGILSLDGNLANLRSAGPAPGTQLVAVWPLRIEGMRAALNPLQFDSLDPVGITLDRAVPIAVHERGRTVELSVRGPDLRVALADAGVPIWPFDLVRPSPDSTPRAGMHVYLERAKDLTLKVDGRTLVLRSRAVRVSDLLGDQGIALGPLDRVTPAACEPLRDDTQVQVVRVREDWVVEEVITSFSVQRSPTPELGLGQKRVTQAGAAGLLRRIYLIRLEDGQEVQRNLTATETPADPRTEVIEYGTRASSVMTPEGPQEFIRTMRVFATWYNASHGGKPLSSPGYGFTSIGLRATHGVMAVDPRVIPYWTKAYVPGYGIAVAGDTGGGIRGAMIDLAFDEDVPVNWSTRYVDIYILGSPTLQDALRAAFPDG